jgi:hypothetical protein
MKHEMAWFQVEEMGREEEEEEEEEKEERKKRERLQCHLCQQRLWHKH